MRLALIPSPFVGAVCWQATAAALPGARVVDYGGVSGPDWYEGVAARAAAQADGEPWIAVLHSGAGGFAPAIANASRDLVGFIFVDAVLPYPGRSNLETAPPDFAARLRAVTHDGELAAWSTWFDVDPTIRMIPDVAIREAFLRAQPRVPFAFLEVVSPQADALSSLPCGYLQLSKSYQATADKAEALGWPVVRLRAHHLAMASDPQQIAAEIARLAGRLL